MAHSWMLVAASMEAERGELKSSAMSPNTQPGVLWTMIFCPSTCSKRASPSLYMV